MLFLLEEDLVFLTMSYPQTIDKNLTTPIPCSQERTKGGLTPPCESLVGIFLRIRLWQRVKKNVNS